MRSRSEFSAQTLSVLAALFAEPVQWQHGYALAKLTGLKSGTLYPILIRLADRGLVEACWEQEPTPGRPRRHLYRLTAAGGPAPRGRSPAQASPERRRSWHGPPAGRARGREAGAAWHRPRCHEPDRRRGGPLGRATDTGQTPGLGGGAVGRDRSGSAGASPPGLGVRAELG
jgi:PadR family transcriptional regulator PadR